MTALVKSILNKRLSEANEHLAEDIVSCLELKLFEMKKATAAKMCNELNLDGMEPDYSGIEDRRGEKAVNSSAKTNLGGDQTANKSAKGDLQVTTVNKTVKEEEQLDEQRVKIIRARIRNGKVQRRKKVSNVAGMTIRGGKLTRMSPAERRKRKMGARRAKIKRKGKMSRILQKRKRSMRRRQSMGL